VKWLLILGGIGALLAWLHSIGALDPKLWKDTVAREKQRIPEQVKEAVAAGKRAAGKAEEDLDREVRQSFRADSGPSPSG
jgi:hypothetical protein